MNQTYRFSCNDDDDDNDDDNDDDDDDDDDDNKEEKNGKLHSVPNYLYLTASNKSPTYPSAGSSQHKSSCIEKYARSSYKDKGAYRHIDGP